MRGQYEELSCPFCDKGRIKCWYIPSTVSIKVKKTASLPGSKTFTRNPDIWLIQSGCSDCGKSQEEVEKELRVKNII